MKDKSQQKVHRVNTKINEADYNLLLLACVKYKFSSIYELLQALLICFLRYMDKERDMQEEKGMDVEINEMFAELETPAKRQRMFTSYSMNRPKK